MAESVVSATRRWLVPRPGLARDLVVVAAVVGTAATAGLTILPLVRLAYENPSLHVALDTAEGMVAALLASIAYSRAVTRRRRADVLVAVSFAAFAVTNLGRAISGSIDTTARVDGIELWITLILALLGSSAFALAANTPESVPAARRSPVQVVAGTFVVVAVLAAVAVLAQAALPEVLDTELAPESRDRPRLVGNPLVLAIQLLLGALCAAAAAGFVRRHRREGDDLLAWFAAGATMRGFARLNYFLFPSLYSTWIYTGDLLRLAAYGFFLAGAAREVADYWRQRALVNVLEERERVARELHDGLVQELAFLRSQLAPDRPPSPEMLPHLHAAAVRAATESRRALTDLAARRAPDLATAIRHEARKVAVPLGVRVDVRVDGDVDLSAESWPNVARIVREATANAIRHGSASSVVVRATNAGANVCIEIRDDGRGFDPHAVAGGFGLVNMRDRAVSLGGDLEIVSATGGTTIVVTVPR